MTWPSGSRVLAVRLDSIGDVLMTSPALRALKRGGVARHITLLTSSAGAEAAALVPEVDDVLVYDAPWMKPPPADPDPTGDLEAIESLRHGVFDASAIFTVYSQSVLPAALFCRLAGIPRRLGHCRENPYHLLTDWVRDREPEAGVRHEVRRQLDLVESVGARTADDRIRLHIRSEARRSVDRLLEDLGLPGSRWVVVHPGAAASSRRYPWRLFVEVADRLVGSHGIRVVFTGSRHEARLVDMIRGGMAHRSISLAGRLALPELAALIDRASLLLSNNTGPVHIAAGLATPVVVLYALTNPQHTPWGVPSRVLSVDVPCAPCYSSVCRVGHQGCLARVPPAQVEEAVVDLLGAGAAAAVAWSGAAEWRSERCVRT